MSSNSSSKASTTSVISAADAVVQIEIAKTKQRDGNPTAARLRSVGRFVGVFEDKLIIILFDYSSL